MSAYAGHLLTKSRDNLKRLRDYDSAWRKVMLDRCVELLSVTTEAKVWVRVKRGELAHLIESESEKQGCTTEDASGASTDRNAETAAAKELRHKIDLELIALLLKTQNVGEIARDFCPTESSKYSTELTLNVAQLLLYAKDDPPATSFMAAEASVDASVRKMHRLIRSTYNTELYDSLDPRKFRKRLRYGFTENRRREFRKRIGTEIVAEAGNEEGAGS